MEKIFAVDISPKAVENFNEIVSDNAKKNYASVANFAEPNLNLGRKFSLILFAGVLHHMTNDLEEVFKNIDAHLEKHGLVIFIEPNADFLDSIRKIWYRVSDNFDHTNERALKAKEIHSFAKQNNLQLDKLVYFGSIGFFLILQKGKDGNAYNLANNKENIKIIDLAKIISKIPNYSVKIIVKGKKKYLHQTSYTNYYKPLVTKLKKLGWVEKVNLKEGFSRIIKYLYE